MNMEELQKKYPLAGQFLQKHPGLTIDECLNLLNTKN